VPPRSRIDADERAAIIRAAYTCLSAPHSGPVSVAAILDAAGMSTRAFYRHFESKDELFLAMLRSDADWVARRMRSLVEETPGGSIAELTACVDFLLALAYDPRSRAHIVVLDSDEVRVAKGYREANAELRLQREEIFANILRRGCSDGTFPMAEPERDSAAIIALVDRAFTDPMSGVGPDREQLVGYVVDFALRALGARNSRHTDESAVRNSRHTDESAGRNRSDH
jgi:AcrR family transcriptional regulator